MSIAALLQAAEYLERREREAEHGYASTLPMPDNQQHHHQHHNGNNNNNGASVLSTSSSRIKVKKTQGSRSTHNELEKNRRAQLRTCLEKLKDLVPLGPESARHTTLGLLTRAKHFIKTLEERDRRHLQYKDQLYREQRFLRRKLEQLGQQYENVHQLKRRANSLSECSVTSSTTSTASSSSSLATSETGITAFDDEVDVIGYGSHGSDMDDQLSVESASSDSGIGLGNGGNAMTSCNGNNNAGSVASHFPHLSITDV